MSASEESCPVCWGPVDTPSQPCSNCGKVFCQTCLNHSVQFRKHCPYCRGTESTASVNNQSAHPAIPMVFETHNSRRVGASIQNIIGQLQDSQAQPVNTGTQVRLNQAAPQNQVPPRFPPRPFAIPCIRRQSAITSLAPAPVSAVPALPPNPARFRDNPADFDCLTVRIFTCPYCQENGLDELVLRDHCNEHHANDSTRVVCPVCVATPHGDQQYYSRNFISHLNLRHSYYMDDITNLDRSDEMNFQIAILASYKQSI